MISVIMACHNGANTIRQALDSLVGQTYTGDWEIILSDNGSTDTTRDIFLQVAAENPRIAMRVVDSSGIAGRGHAVNVGVAAAAGDRLAFLDDDDTVEPGWLAALDAALAEDEFVAARTDTSKLNPAWLAELRPHPQRKGLLRFGHAPFCDHAGGATLAMTKRVYEDLGGFDPTVVVLEDNDFCIRAYQKGYRLKFAPDAVYNYRFRANQEAIFRQSYAYAKWRTLIRARYAGRKGPARALRAWVSSGLEAGKLGLMRLRLAVTGGTEVEAAAFAHRWGDLKGDLVGAVTHHVAPLGRRGFGIRGKLRRAAVSAVRIGLAPWYGSTISVKTRQNVMALTFDDGPDPESTPRLLDALARVGAKATFFVVGSRAERHPEIVARILAEGHEIGNHTWDHPSLPTQSPGRIEAQLDMTRRALAPEGQRLMRPPFGDQDFRTVRIARRMGYRIVLWSVSGEDWVGRDATTLADRIVGQAAPGAIVLLHDSLYNFEQEAYRDRTPTIDAVTQIVERLPDYRFVTVSELLACGDAVERARMKVSADEYLRNLGSSVQAAPLAGELHAG